MIGFHRACGAVRRAQAWCRGVSVLMLLGCCLNVPVFASAWEVYPSEQVGLPVLAKGGAVAMQPSLSLWGANWAWYGPSTSMTVNGNGSYTLTGRSNTLGVDITAQGTVVSPQQMVWDFTVQAAQTMNGVVGGGLAFKFDLTTFQSALGIPSINSDGSGWVWGADKASQVRVDFSPALQRVFFEGSGQNQIRAFFYNGSIPAGTLKFRMTVRLSSDMHFESSLSERLGGSESASWPTDSVDWQYAPVDLSFLNAAEKPAGKHGFLRASGDQLVFEDGTVGRFWGTNLSAYTLFSTPKDQVPLQAKRLSALGFNLVRLHHHDSPWVSPNIFGRKSDMQNTQKLDPEMQGKIDWWIKCLKEEGIYVWLDMEVQHQYMASDNIWAFDEMAKGKSLASLKGFNYVNISIQQAMKQFTQAYITHVNSFTGLAYKDDPAVAAMLITNENDLTNHYGIALQPDKNVPQHSKLYMDEANAFAAAHNLSKSLVWRAWEPGPSKLFLNDLEYRFNVGMIAQMRSLGVRVPIATTSTWASNPLYSLPALTAGDVIDVHSYGNDGELGNDPHYTSMMTDFMAMAQVIGKPVTVSEWNVGSFPGAQRASAPLQVGAMAAFQGWDAMMLYAYSQSGLARAPAPSNWETMDDPAILATVPAAALMYRRGDVQLAHKEVVFQPSTQQLYYEAWGGRTASALRLAAQRSRLGIALPATPELPWLKASTVDKGAEVLSSPQIAVDDGMSSVTSDTGELTHNWDLGTYTIKTPRTQAAAGWIGGQKLALGEVDVDVRTPNMSLAVQTLDGQTIATSHSLMLSFSGRAVPGAKNTVPYRVEPLDGTVVVRAPKGLHLYRRVSGGDPIAVSYQSDGYHIPLSAGAGTNWLFLRE